VPGDDEAGTPEMVQHVVQRTADPFGRVYATPPPRRATARHRNTTMMAPTMAASRVGIERLAHLAARLTRAAGTAQDAKRMNPAAATTIVRMAGGYVRRTAAAMR
jgi:hypothetical protein